MAARENVFNVEACTGLLKSMFGVGAKATKREIGRAPEGQSAPRSRSSGLNDWRTQFSRILKIGLLCIGTGTWLGAGALLAQTHPYRAASDAPASWQRFSAQLKTQLEIALLAETSEAKRFREWCQASRKSGDQAAPDSMIVKLWVNPDGKVHRAIFAQLPNMQANDDLSAVLTKATVAETPPSDMLQPVSLRIAFEQCAGAEGAKR